MDSYSVIVEYRINWIYRSDRFCRGTDWPYGRNRWNGGHGSYWRNRHWTYGCSRWNGGHWTYGRNRYWSYGIYWIYRTNRSCRGTYRSDRRYGRNRPYWKFCSERRGKSNGGARNGRRNLF